MPAPRPSSSVEGVGGTGSDGGATGCKRQRTTQHMPSGFQIFVRTVYSKSVILWVESGDTIADAMEKLLNAMGFIFTSPRDIRLVSAVRDLEDDPSLGEYNIQSGACLWMLKRLRCGMDGGFDDDEAYFQVWVFAQI